MTNPLARTARKLKEAISRRLPKRRDDSGLTTLEWLLIVAAVAGMAALAVVLVTNVVGDTSDQIAGQSARRTAAELAAQEITDECDSRHRATTVPSVLLTSPLTYEPQVRLDYSSSTATLTSSEFSGNPALRMLLTTAGVQWTATHQLCTITPTA